MHIVNKLSLPALIFVAVYIKVSKAMPKHSNVVHRGEYIAALYAYLLDNSQDFLIP